MHPRRDHSRTTVQSEGPFATGLPDCALPLGFIVRSYGQHVIELTKFRLLADADELAFLRADEALQQEFAYQQPGLVRRTVARDEDERWIVIDLWRSVEDADACSARWDSDPVVERFTSFVDPSSVTNERYMTLQ